MRAAAALAPGMGALALRRLTRTQNVTWPRPRLYAALLAASTNALIAGTTVIGSHPPDDPLLIALYPPAIGVAVALLAAAAVMAMEGTRDRSGTVERALAGLPIQRREATLLVRLPSLVIALLLTTVPLAPAVAALTSIGWTVTDALSFATVSLASGLITIGIPYLVVAALMTSERWGAVRFPVGLLLWAAAFVWQTVLALRELAGAQAPLPLPLTVALASTMRGTLSTAEALLLTLCGMGVTIAVALTFLISGGSRRPSLVRIRWKGRWRLAGEVIYALRDPALRANLVLAALLNAIIVVAVFRLPADVRGETEELAVILLGIFAVAAARPIRGLYPAPLPVQRLLLMDATSWAFSTSIVVTIVASLVAVPGVALLEVSTDPGASIVRLAGTIALSAAGAVGVGSVIPVGSRNVLGQGASGALAIGAYLALALALRPISAVSSGAAAALSSAVLVAAVVLAVLVENLRWRPAIAERKDAMP